MFAKQSTLSTYIYTVAYFTVTLLVCSLVDSLTLCMSMYICLNSRSFDSLFTLVRLILPPNGECGCVFDGSSFICNEHQFNIVAAV